MGSFTLKMPGTSDSLDSSRTWADLATSSAATMKPRVRPTPPNLQKQSMSCGTR